LSSKSISNNAATVRGCPACQPPQSRQYTIIIDTSIDPIIDPIIIDTIIIEAGDSAYFTMKTLVTS
jgi:hypothetical protein